MTPSVTLPLWLFALLLALAAWALAERMLLPGMRWFLRRRVNRVIEELSARLSIELPQFKLTRRQVVIDRLFHDTRVQAAVDAYCASEKLPRAAALRRVDRYAREIVPSFNAYLYFRVGYSIAKAVARTLYRVRLGYADEAALARIDPRSSIVFVINHRSNMDYVLVAFLAAERVALSYAVGEWARVWPLQTLIRAMGAYFVRRNSGDPLYRAVLARYVQMATEAGVPQALFPEGGLSRDGRLRKPKLGLLDYMLKAFDPQAGRDLVFIPVGINYDRVLEDRTLLAGLDSAAPKAGLAAALATTFGFIARNLWLRLTGRWYRFGYACVNFGAPVSMREQAQRDGGDLRVPDDAQRRARVEALGERLMQAIGRVVPVLPVSVVAWILLHRAGGGLSELELKAQAFDLMRELEARGAHVYLPRRDRDYAIGVGLRMLLLRRIAVERDGLYTADPRDAGLLAYYANAIGHLIE
ncbi:MAG TPA: 1-acyl-sn-glycerol-3-phosphate acyltransferase [Burkholderiales bacterium]|nr:1-acyl-sn-glycerol-3-phosphate acyltransferase [Burkholderiales bacterium]